MKTFNFITYSKEIGKDSEYYKANALLKHSMISEELIVWAGRTSRDAGDAPAKQPKNSKDEVVTEGAILSKKDLYYNKEAFDNGDINLCVVIGLSGSGKTTLARKAERESNYEIDNIALDDVISNKIQFSMDNLKAYSDMMYSFFSGPGKKYYHTKEDVDEGRAKKIDNYDEKLIKDFLKFAISYTNSHKNKKYILEGIWPLMYATPSMFKDCAVILKNTSILKSRVRAICRELGNKAIGAVNQDIKNIPKQFNHQAALNKYNRYFESLMKESVPVDFNDTGYNPYDNWSIMESRIDNGNGLIDYVLEAVNDTYIIKESIYPMVEKVLSTPQGDRKFRNLVKKFIDKNSSKLHTSGPVYQVPFTDDDKLEFFNLFETDKKEVTKIITDMTKTIKADSDWKLIRQNPIFCVFYECIRYYTLKKDTTGVNVALAIYALSVYPSVFSNVFRYGANPEIMQYTIDHLTAKYLIKQQGDIFSTLVVSIQNSYKFLAPNFNDSPDKEVIRFVARIRNDQKSLLKNIANHYYDNHRKGLRATTSIDVYDDSQINVDVTNDTSRVEDITRKVTLGMITNGVDITRAAAAAKVSYVSVSDLKFYLTKIFTEDRNDELQKFIESILFIFLYQEKHTVNEINEMKFLSFANVLFKRTNSNDVNVVRIKDFLSKWSEDSGISGRFKRAASQINYKRGIFMYIILCIQYYNS